MNRNESTEGTRHYQVLKEFNDGTWKNTPDIKKKIRMNENNLRKIIKHFDDIQVIQSLQKLSDVEQKEEIKNRIKRVIRSDENYYRITEKGKTKLKKFDEACLDSDARDVFKFGLNL